MCDGADHDGGLQQDLRALGRRRLLKLGLAAGGAGLVAGCGWPPGMSEAQAEKSAVAEGGAECVLHPTETAGPYPADGSNRAHGTLANVLTDSGVVRRDMRPDVGATDQPADGERLDLTLRLVDVNRACAPLSGYALYLWHCDAAGAYSIYDLKDRSYLRGVGVSDAQGAVSFTTIVPGCYRGRYPHMHFEVYPSLAKATDYRNRILTSQLAIPAATCEAVYSGHPAYAASIGNYQASPLDRDGIFRDNTPKQLAAQTIAVAAGAGEATIGLDV